MSPERYDHLLRLVSPFITKEDTNLREAIPAGERLAVALWFLTSGESQQSLSFAYRIGKSTLSRILRETCDAIFSVLKDPYLKPPTMIGQILKKFFEISGIYPMLLVG